MGLLDVFAAVKERMPTDYPVTFEFNPGDQDKHGSPRRITVDFGKEGFGGTRGAGRAGQPVPLWTRLVNARVELWGNDFGDTEVLLGHFVAALHVAAHGSYGMGGGEWVLGGVSAKGAIYRLDIELQIPLTREPDTLATITGMPTTPVLSDIEE